KGLRSDLEIRRSKAINNRDRKHKTLNTHPAECNLQIAARPLGDLQIAVLPYPPYFSVGSRPVLHADLEIGHRLRSDLEIRRSGRFDLEIGKGLRSDLEIRRSGRFDLEIGHRLRSDLEIRRSGRFDLEIGKGLRSDLEIWRSGIYFLWIFLLPP